MALGQGLALGYPVPARLAGHALPRTSIQEASSNATIQCLVLAIIRHSREGGESSVFLSYPIRRATHSTLANGVPSLIGSVSIAKPQSANNSFHWARERK